MRLITILIATAVIRCQTTESRVRFDPKDAPEITQQTPTPRAIEASINFGGETLRKTRQLITARNEWPLVEKLLVQAIMDNVNSYENFQLANAVLLYQTSPGGLSESVFFKLVSSGRPLARQFGWQLAAAKPSKAVAFFVEKELTRAVAENDEKSVFLPQVAAAVQANRLSSSYTLMRQGLLSTNQESFAAAMASLDPRKSSEDFLTYLALAPVDELRQMNLKTVDSFTCLFALNHLRQHPASTSNPQIDVLYLYAVSRNTSLADIANQVLERYFSDSPGLFAQILSRQPVWVQVAFIENVRRNSSGQKRKLLVELQKITVTEEVIDELRETHL